MLLLLLLNRMGIPVAGGQGMVINLLDAGLSFVGATDTLTILTVIIAITAVQTALSIGLTWWTAKLTRGYQSERQMELFAALMRANWGFLSGQKAGDMTSAVLVECDRLKAGLRR